VLTGTTEDGGVGGMERGQGECITQVMIGGIRDTDDIWKLAG